MTTLHSRSVGLRMLSRETRLLLAIFAIFGFSYNGIGLVLRPLYVLHLGFGTEYYGLYSSLGNFSFMAGSFAAGWVGMRLGTRRAMILGALGCLIGTAIMPAAEFFDRSLWQVIPIVSNLIQSFAWALVSVNLVPTLTGVTAEEQRDRAIGLSNTLQGVGILLGNLLAGVLPRLCSGLLGTPVESNEGFRLSMSLVLIFGLVMLITLWALPTPQTRRQKAVVANGPAPMTPLLIVGVFAFLLPVAAASIGTYATPYLDQELRLSTEAIGAISSISQGLAVLGMMATPWLVRRFTGRRAVILVSAVMSLCLIPMAAVPHWGAAALSRAVTGAVNMMRMTVMQMFAMAQVPQEHRPLMSGVLSTANGLCFALVSYLGGVLAAYSGYRAMFWVSAAATLTATLLFAAVTAPLVKQGRLERA